MDLDDIIFTMYVETVQEFALANVGRYLTDRELEDVKQELMAVDDYEFIASAVENVVYGDDYRNPPPQPPVDPKVRRGNRGIQ